MRLLQEDKVIPVVLVCIHLHNLKRQNYALRSLNIPPGTIILSTHIQ